MIPLARPYIGEEEIAAFKDVLLRGMLVQGEQCSLLESELAKYLGVPHVIVVSSGTAALHLALMASDIGPGDAVIIPDFTFPATANVVESTGARPIPVDVDPYTYNITPEVLEMTLETLQTKEKIRAVMPVHQFGCPVGMSAVKEIASRYGLTILEDAACALGSEHDGMKIGTHGDCSCFSFHPRKIITSGEGGAIATNNRTLAERLRALRNHGIQTVRNGRDIFYPGLNYRMAEPQAAMLRVQLKRLDGFLRKRKGLSDIYHARLEESPIQLPKALRGHSWQTYMVVLPDHVDRNDLIQYLKDRGIETSIGSYAIHALRYYREKYPRDFRHLETSYASKLYAKGLALPLYVDMNETELERVVAGLMEGIEAKDR